MNHSQTGVVDLRRRDDDSDEGVERRQELVKDDHRVHREGRRVEVGIFHVFLALSFNMIIITITFNNNNGQVRRDDRGRRDPGWHYPQRDYSDVNG